MLQQTLTLNELYFHDIDVRASETMKYRHNVTMCWNSREKSVTDSTFPDSSNRFLWEDLDPNQNSFGSICSLLCSFLFCFVFWMYDPDVVVHVDLARDPTMSWDFTVQDVQKRFVEMSQEYTRMNKSLILSFQCQYSTGTEFCKGAIKHDRSH